MAESGNMIALVLLLVMAVTLHEVAHGYVAGLLGDPTARLMKRVTLNPLRHAHPIGTFVLPGLLYLTHAPFLFGFARPVPVDFGRLRHIRRDTILVALAGPVTNLALGYASALLLHLEVLVTPEQAPHLFEALYLSVNINVLLCVFNLLPVYPLDGGRVVGALLPGATGRIYVKSGKYVAGLLAAVILLSGLGSRIPFIDNLKRVLLVVPVETLRDGLLHAAGIGNV